MPAGAGMTIAFDPPGAVGFVLSDGPGVLLRLDETTTAQRPQDAAGSLFDLNAGTVATAGILMTMPAVTDGAVGKSRTFTANNGTGAANNGLVTTDIVTGTTLYTRDVSVQTIIAIDVAGQAAASGTGTIIKRGLAYKFSIGIDNVASRLAHMQGDTGTSVQFTVPTGYTLLTWTRRWVSSSLSVERYYIGDVLVGENNNAFNPSGATTDPTFVGFGQSSGFDPFVGSIDQIAVYERELTREEIESTWLRITRYQPQGVKLFVDTHDPGFPMSLAPDSDVQLENRLVGNALGFAGAQIENIRRNMLPQRAYGSVLKDWETVTRPTAQPGDSIDQRRARVLARIRQRRGVSIGGLQDALQGLLGGADPSQLQFLAFTNTVTDDFSTALNLSRWDVTPVGALSVVSGQARCAPGAGSFIAPTSWRTMAMAVGGDGKAAQFIGKAVFTTPQSLAEVGIFFGDAAIGNYLLLGLRDTAGLFQVVTESYIANVSQGFTVQQTLGGNPAAIWFHLLQSDTPGAWFARWSTVSGTAGFVNSTAITHPTLQNRAGFYLRSTAVLAAVADFDDAVLRAPFGTRPFNAYVLLDSALGFDPDVDGATSVYRAIKHAHTDGCFIESKTLLCDTPFGCDCGPMGGI